MKWAPSLLLAAAAVFGMSSSALAQATTPGTEPHADGAPGAGPSTKKKTKSTKTHSAQPAPGTEPHADGNPGAGTKKKKPSSSKKTDGPTPGTEPHQDGNPGVKPKQ